MSFVGYTQTSSQMLYRCDECNRLEPWTLGSVKGMDNGKHLSFCNETCARKYAILNKLPPMP
jgi:hypothetical protein